MHSDAERIWDSLLRFEALVLPRLDRTVQRATGLPLTWYDVLLELWLADGRLTMGELGERVVLSRTRVSRLVDELSRAGLVVREANPDDGRSSFAALTPEGLRRFQAARKVYLPAIDDEVGRLPDAELAVVAEGLERLLAAARAADDER
ncbi:MarR family winged helix-turn-helix transcriptional regulator [Protaetiibacter larvae]|uniref:MarR family transcriptional regulator n=1 Tax=Protaetiibacter larvae TaxID=2592654 RepID=A0A5C1Y502_9MICO|nr:MarR family transcriptional regulator [Protaetiibacter larvae]QEO08780.1 MarR family transcriptional regulator [Protaetiibacter larvae]